MKKNGGKRGILSLARLYGVLNSLYTSLPYRLCPSRALPPLHLFIELTYRCNLRCEMCQFIPLLEGAELNRRREEELTAREVIAFVRSFPRTSVVTFTGGEPLLRKDFPEIIRDLGGRNKLHIITNGTLLTEETVSLLWENRLRTLLGGGLFALGVSLHGPPEIHDEIVGREGAYDEAVAGIGRLNALKKKSKTRYPHIHTTAVITDRNAGCLAQIYETSCDLDADYCNFTLCTGADFTNRLDMGRQPDYEASPPRTTSIDSGVLREQFALIEEAAGKRKTEVRFSPFGISYEEVIRYYRNETDLSRFTCDSPWRVLGVSAYGDVSSCPFSSLGNIRETNASKLWNGEKQARLRRSLKKRGVFPICLGCCQSIYRG